MAAIKKTRILFFVNTLKLIYFKNGAINECCFDSDFSIISKLH